MHLFSVQIRQREQPFSSFELKIGTNQPNFRYASSSRTSSRGDQFISSQEKLHELQQALPALLAVEMEGAAVAQVAYEYNLPFIVIRIISDKANDDSHIDFPRFIEEIASHFTAGIIKRLI